MKRLLILLAMPALLLAQEFTFQFQPAAFPVDIGGWQPFCPWGGGLAKRPPNFVTLMMTAISIFSSET